MRNGKQYIAMFVGDGKQPGEIVAFALPDTMLASRRPERTEE
jgi:hypothetical protein